jgi:uncharacterized protein YbjT (DUF2867 family)
MQGLRDRRAPLRPPAQAVDRAEPPVAGSKEGSMHVLVTGATGFVGSALLAGLSKTGWAVTAVRRPGGEGARGPAARWVALDMARASASDWRGALLDVDAVVNCAGVFDDGLADSTAGVHVAGARALFRACVDNGVRRVIHLSAIGVEDGLTRFARTKLAGEQELARLDLDWVILRPTVILGRPAYGGGALIRGLAALPVLPVDREAGRLAVVQLDDVVATIERLLPPEAPSKLVLDLAGPDALPFTEVVGRYRAWLGWPPAKVVRAPAALLGAVYRLGDMAAALGWRTPIRSSARLELRRGAEGDPARWTAATGIAPTSLGEALAATPASLQERRFAELYFLAPVVIAVTALFWIATGVASLTFGYAIGVGLLEEAGLGRLSGPSVVAGGLADVLIGLGIAFRPAARPALWAAIAASLFYAIAGTLQLPRLWLDPIGPMLKIWPLIVLNIVALVMARKR